MKNRIKIFTLIALAIVFVAAFWFAANKYINWSETGENHPAVPWLPYYASNVSFQRTSNWRIFEFDVTEANFRMWASRHDLSEIREPFYMERFNYKGTQIIGGSESERIDPSEFDPQTVVIVRNGLKYHSWTSNRGGICVCFDRDNNRAYFHARMR